MAEVVGLAYDAGLRNPAKLATAAAIATAESGRLPTKLGDQALENAQWGPSVGLWQIRSLKAEKGKGTTRDQTKLTDPAFNAKAMVSISGGGSAFGAWTVTKPSNPLGFMRFQAALPIATAAATQVLATKGAGAAVETAAGALDPITQVAEVISQTVQTPVRVINWLTDGSTWLRIGWFAGGLGLVLIGAATMAGRPVTGLAKTAVKTVLPTGKIAKAATAAGKGT